MQRSSFFHHPAHEPLRQDSSFALNDEHTRGPFAFLNPTRARLHPTLNPLSNAQSSSSEKPASATQRQNCDGISSPHPSTLTSPAPSEHQEKNSSTSFNFEWRSRDNRKGRHKLLVTHQSSSSSSPTNYLTPPSTTSPRHILHIIFLQLTYAPVWDVSYLVAVIFTLGSAIWVVNAFFVWLPLVAPYTEFPGEIAVAGGWTAFAGATVFEVGSVLLMFEAVNANKSGCFGWALEKVLTGDDEQVTIKPKKEGCAHHQSNSRSFVGKGAAAKSLTNEKQQEKGGGESNDEGEDPDAGKSWQWFPSWHDLTHHYIYELGFLACAFQMFGATIFYISGFTAIPQVYNMLTTDPAVTGAYWVPQIVGGCGFTISSLLFMLETQRKWYIPAPMVLGWHIGLYNLVGAVGFTLCGVFGLYDDDPYWADQASLATFWGSWAFLLGSVLQWYESLDTHPVEVRKQA